MFEFDPTASNAVPITDQVSLDIWRRDLGLIDVETGKVRRLTTHSRIGHYVLSPDGQKIAYCVLTGSEKPGAGQYLYQIVMQDLRSGETKVVAPNVRLTLYANSFGWSPNGEWIAYRTGGPLAKDEVHLISINGAKDRSVANNPSEDPTQIDIDPPVWDASARNVYFLRGNALWRVPVTGEGASSFAKDPSRKLELIAPRQLRLFSPDQGHSAILQTISPSTKRVGFAKIDLTTGAVSQLFDEDKRYGGYGTEPTISPDGTSLAYVAEDALHPPNIYITSGGSMASKKVTEVAPALSGAAFGKAEVVEWRSTDGLIQHGALVYPANYEKGKTYPLIVKIYGGSEISNDLNRFGYATGSYENLQIFATRGYAILLADSTLNVGTPMVDLMKSVMPGINKVIDMGVADPDRLGVTGHSYGGYSTIALLVQSPRFKAAVMRAGMGDLISGYGQLGPDGSNYGLAWAESGQGRMGGSPWEYRERYIENSPIYYLDRVQTPLLIIHGGEDNAVPTFLADQIFTGLRRLSKPVTYARYANEGHWEGDWSYANQVDALQRTIAWFQKYLKPSADRLAQTNNNQHE